MDEALRQMVMEVTSGQVFGVWFLIGAALVFWMQAGFAMVEAGFTRAKNTGNIIMKNLMDFCIGTIVFGVWLLDYKLHIDDPVGAVAVHCVNGIWGTIAVGLFATDAAPEYSITNVAGETVVGLFYGGGFELLGKQLLGIICVAAWTAVTITITFLVIKKTVGIRVAREEEITGLDATEHGMPSAYAGFAMAPEYINEEYAPVAVAGEVPVADAVEVKAVPTFEKKTAKDGVKMTKIEIVCKEARLEALKNAMVAIGITGMTVSHFSFTT